MKRILLLTGSPGVGKTSILVRVVEKLKLKGFRVGGMISREVRSSGNRVGFEILSLAENQRGWLAQVNQKEGPQVGKYRVNLLDLDRVGVAALRQALKESDLVVIDEIGKMELLSSRFKEAVTQVLNSGKRVLGTIMLNPHPFADEIKRHPEVEVLL